MSMENKSLYDPNRKTVGAIYRDAQLQNTAEGIRVGDLTRELASSLVDDLNETIKSNPFDDQPFYILVHESKDMMMPKAIRRRMCVMKRRPYPEDDTVVFRTDPKLNMTWFCWCLPHHTEMNNVLINAHQYEKSYIQQIQCWKRIEKDTKDVDLTPFGFYKDENQNWQPNPKWEGDTIVSGQPEFQFKIIR